MITTLPPAFGAFVGRGGLGVLGHDPHLQHPLGKRVGIRDGGRGRLPLSPHGRFEPGGVHKQLCSKFEFSKKWQDSKNGFSKKYRHSKGELSKKYRYSKSEFSKKYRYSKSEFSTKYQ
jgi:hypothetical protein